jgi:hypothetical protein
MYGPRTTASRHDATSRRCSEVRRATASLTRCASSIVIAERHPRGCHFDRAPAPCWAAGTPGSDEHRPSRTTMSALPQSPTGASASRSSVETLGARPLREPTAHRRRRSFVAQSGSIVCASLGLGSRDRPPRLLRRRRDPEGRLRRPRALRSPRRGRASQFPSPPAQNSVLTGIRSAKRPARSTPKRWTPEYQAAKAIAVTATARYPIAARSSLLGSGRAWPPSTSTAATPRPPAAIAHT